VRAVHPGKAASSRSTRKPAARGAGPGPLVRTLASHLAYYERWAKTWEFQALLKARPVARRPWRSARPTRTLSARWSGRRPAASTSSRTCRPCGAGLGGKSLPARQAGRELKLGPGAGCVTSSSPSSCCSWLHGPPRTRRCARPPTLPALAALAAGGYGRPGRRRRARRRLPVPAPHRAPAPAEPALAARTPCRRIPPYFAGWGGAMRFNDGPNEPWFPGFGGPGSAPTRRPTSTRSGAATPAGQAAAREAVLPAAAGRGWPGCRPRRPRLDAGRGPGPARGARLRRSGRGRCGTSTALTFRAYPAARPIQRTLLPVLLGWFADAAEPDAGLLAFRQVSEALGSSPWYLRLLRDETQGGPSGWPIVLASSRYATGLLLAGAPEAGRDSSATTPSWNRRSLTGLARRDDGGHPAVRGRRRGCGNRRPFRSAAASSFAPPRKILSGGTIPPQGPPPAHGGGLARPPIPPRAPPETGGRLARDRPRRSLISPGASLQAALAGRACGRSPPSCAARRRPGSR